MKRVGHKLINGLNSVFSWLRFSYSRTTKYPANLISWFLADMSMYVSTVLMFALIGTSFYDMGGYTSNQFTLFLANSFLINNLFSVLFSEAIDDLSNDIWNGNVAYHMLKPKSLHAVYVSRKLNLKSLLSTPFLIAFWFYAITLNGLELNFEFLLTIVLASVIMGQIFFILTNFDFIGIHSESFSPISIQLLNIRERPDYAFRGLLRNLFLYVVPIFLTSAIPTAIQLGFVSSFEKAWFYIAVVVLVLLNKTLLYYNIRKYNLGTEN